MPSLHFFVTICLSGWLTNIESFELVLNSQRSSAHGDSIAMVKLVAKVWQANYIIEQLATVSLACTPIGLRFPSVQSDWVTTTKRSSSVCSYITSALVCVESFEACSKWSAFNNDLETHTAIAWRWSSEGQQMSVRLIFACVTRSFKMTVLLKWTGLIVVSYLIVSYYINVWG